MGTPFSSIARRFKSLITEPLYAELPPEVAAADINSLIMDNIDLFEFPKKSLNYDEVLLQFDEVLTAEEINIIARLCLENWMDRYINNTEVMRLEYGDKDFKISGQAAELNALTNTRDRTGVRTKYLMRLYNRRNASGRPNYSGLAGGAMGNGNG